MSKKFQFSTGYSIELASNGIITNGYEPSKLNIDDIKSVFIKNPVFLSNGYINLGEDYIPFKGKDKSIVEDFANDMKKLGIIVAQRKKKSAENYIESVVSVGGNCCFFTIINGDLVYYYFHDVYKINYEEINSIYVSKNLFILGTDDNPLSNPMVISEENNVDAFLSFRKKDYQYALDFAKKIKDLANRNIAIITV